MMMTRPQFKSTLRKAYQKIRTKLSENFQNLESIKVCNNIQKLNIYKKANQIALYQAMRGEVNLELLWKKACEEKKVSSFPILAQGKTLVFIPATPKNVFIPNRHGILEPNTDKEDSKLPSQLDIIFLPLVSFNRMGTRLGMGQGYYDRTLAKSKPHYLIGVAYDFQCYPNLEAQPWDIPLDGVITPNKIYCFNDKLINTI